MVPPLFTYILDILGHKVPHVLPLPLPLFRAHQEPVDQGDRRPLVEVVAVAVLQGESDLPLLVEPPDELLKLFLHFW